MEEIWKPIPDYEGYYEISNMGNIRSVDRTIIDKNGNKRFCFGKKIKLTINHNGYYKVSLNKNDITKTFRVHRLVALTFIPNPNNLPQVNHKDENRLNNNIENLEWCTQEYNLNYGTRNKKISQSHKNRLTT